MLLLLVGHNIKDFICPENINRINTTESSTVFEDIACGVDA